MIRKERNSRVFEEIEGENFDTRDRWLNTFGSFILGHDIYKMKDFGNVIHLLTDLKTILYMSGTPLIPLLIYIYYILFITQKNHQ